MFLRDYSNRYLYVDSWTLLNTQGKLRAVIIPTWTHPIYLICPHTHIGITVKLGHSFGKDDQHEHEIFPRVLTDSTRYLYRDSFHPRMFGRRCAVAEFRSHRFTYGHDYFVRSGFVSNSERHADKGRQHQHKVTAFLNCDGERPQKQYQNSDVALETASSSTNGPDHHQNRTLQSHQHTFTDVDATANNHHTHY